jgi:alcohol dehydrogenase
MKAVQYNKNGDTSVLEIVDASEPVLKDGQILVEVYAASLNPFDYKLRSGITGIPLQFPYTSGADFAGVVKELGEGVTEFKIGDEVFGSAQGLSGGSGAFAESLAANIKNSAQKPKKVDFLQAASLVLVGVSAIQALEEHIKLSRGQKVLIHGGAGGIGSVAIQLAKHIGAYVSTTVSSEDVEFVKLLGADEVINYKEQKFEDNPPAGGYDAVFDLVGSDTTDRSFKVLKKGGILVSMLGQPKEELAKEYEVTAIGQMTNTSSGHLKRLAELIDADAIKPQIDKVFTLDQIKEAFDHLEKESPKGKVVLKIKE